MLCTDNASQFAPVDMRGHLRKDIIMQLGWAPAGQASEGRHALPAILALTRKLWAVEERPPAVASKDFDDEFERALSSLREIHGELGKVRATPFVKGVSLMAAMDWLENKKGLEKDVEIHTTPERACLLFLNCEYQLHKLNMNIPLSYHPALPFWVKTTVKWNNDTLSPRSPRYARFQHAYRFRVEYVKCILDAARNPGEGVLSPQQFLQQAWPKPPSTFRIEEYLDILWQEGIPWTKWYNDLSPEMLISVLQAMESRTTRDQSDLQNSDGVFKPTDFVKDVTHDQGFPHPDAESTNTALPPTHMAGQVMLSGSENLSTTKDDPTRQDNHSAPHPSMDATSLLNLAKSSPSDVQQILTKLPLDLPSMELINAVLTAKPPSLNPAIIACEYIQHGLRMLENPSATTSFSSSEASASASASSSSAGPSNDAGSSSYSPTEQHFKDPGERTRKVELLILFIKNLMRKNVVSFQDLQFDVQEIATRFAGIRKVREFRRWLETGEDVG
ncbi:hypothetical protein K490DRAFT_65704 [Saccharata proteae CBS 121410]|uniref:CCR4-NOT transcription complex subunit 11 n=1 Tax=Saccharata proteae CBS 121410 TaxID=1314787 RepID=A0A9P4HVN6_9PEZI|nr:hypothetical protein K490DRAFT_65704 [Saccharata proteae CBS 121410]